MVTIPSTAAEAMIELAEAMVTILFTAELAMIIWKVAAETIHISSTWATERILLRTETERT